MRSNEVKTVSDEFGFADIYIAGDYALCKNICADFCLDGFCVNISECEYIYTGGAERGVKVGLLNYARFPCGQGDLTRIAHQLAEKLVIGMHQSSASVVSPLGSTMLSRRDD